MGNRTNNPPTVHLSRFRDGFQCPHCDHPHDGEKYLHRLNATTKGWLRVTCQGCGSWFGHCRDITGDAVSFTLRGPDAFRRYRGQP
jgi:transcription elongation factor Elf1